MNFGGCNLWGAAYRAQPMGCNLWGRQRRNFVVFLMCDLSEEIYGVQTMGAATWEVGWLPAEFSRHEVRDHMENVFSGV